MKRKVTKRKSKKSCLKRINFNVMFLCIVAVYAAAVIGGFFTSQNVDTIWYQKIKPYITPPNWVFSVVWNVLFALIALSLYFVWIKSKADKKQKKKIAIVYAVNLFLNVLWVFLFFIVRSPEAAMIELVILWISILYMIGFVHKIDKKSQFLLVPYALWVAYAAAINAIIILFPK
ncbi:MAG: TspO/MBR family protein [Nanoarchaeota archaeon]|nr:TspO/MBR family protein [Nanoarchaeota archaeon]